MFTLFESEKEKLVILDSVITSMTLDEIKVTVGADMCVDRLKGVDTPMGPLTKLAKDADWLSMEVVRLNDKIITLQNDMKGIIKALLVEAQPVTQIITYNPELQALKSKYSIY